MNEPLLRKVQKVILEEPNRVVMSSFYEQGMSGGTVFIENFRNIVPPCLTVACIAGWSAILKRFPDWDFKSPLPVMSAINSVAGADALEITTSQQWLFYTAEWPERFNSKYQRTKTPAELAKLVSDVIDYFIEVDGMQEGA